MEDSRKQKTREELEIMLRKQKEEEERQKEEEERQNFLTFSKHIVPIVTNHFSRTSHPITINAIFPTIFDNDIREMYWSRKNKFKIFDKVVDGYDEFYFEPEALLSEILSD